MIEHYQTTTHVPEALHRLVEMLPVARRAPSEAQAAAAVLGYNFPGSDWYQDSYALLDGRRNVGAAGESAAPGHSAVLSRAGRQRRCCSASRSATSC